MGALLQLTKSKDERVRLGALQTALDRGYGKAVEAEISVFDRLGLDEQQALLTALDLLAEEDAALIEETKLIGNGKT